MSDDQPPKRWHLDPTINLGHLITTGTILVSLVIWGARLESRVDHEADLRTRLESQMIRDQQRDAEAFTEIRRSLQRIENYLLNRRDERP